MSGSIIARFNEYMEKAKAVGNREMLKVLNHEYADLFCGECDDPELKDLGSRIYAIMSELVIMREQHVRRATRVSSDLSEAEHAEILQVQKLIDYNLFTYHFQPIIRAENGEIYAYEALMRAKNMPSITPYHILKYAEMTDRLPEVEQYTFLNILRFIKGHRELFEGKLVFINSMPNVHIDPHSVAEINELLDLLSEKVVVEMTEDSEYKDSELNEIKEKYRGLNIRIAIDDYGTGYSNISNLLRYTPNYVKIDRSLLSGIQNNNNKKHFVREIIDFCHDNEILALAEGVENSEELRTVILLGADLIQGFYTARPSAEVISELPYEIRAEIRSHRQEREDGKRLKIYNAENGEKISLEKLCKDGYTLIRIGLGQHEGSVTVSGTQYLDSGIHIETAENYTGELVLDSARLFNSSDHPCIDIGKNSSLTVTLVGSSALDNSGIRVPETSELTVRGDGKLDIHLVGCDYYGIGNDIHSRHGKLVFKQDGTLTITAESHSGVCIGSGLGGDIDIQRGRYVLRGFGSMNVCIGAYDGDADVNMVGCDIYAEAGGAHSTVIGSLNGSADVSVMYSSVKCKAGSILTTGIGSATGKSLVFRAESVSMSLDVRAEAAALIGAVDGFSDIRIFRSSFNGSADGERVLLFGSLSGNTVLELTDIDFSAVVSTALDMCYVADEKDVHINNGKFRLRKNGAEHDCLI